MSVQKSIFEKQSVIVVKSENRHGKLNTFGKWIRQLPTAKLAKTLYTERL